MPQWVVVESLALAAVVGAFGGVGAAWIVTRILLAHGFAAEREQLRAVLGRARIDLETASSELEKWSTRGSRERARVEQAERRASRREPGEEHPPAALRFADARSYGRHLERGGARDAAFEAALGWKVNGG